MTSFPVAVVGAGIVGLTSALQIRRAGFDVVLFDETPGRGATFAAAGMLAPSAEFDPADEESFLLQRDSVARWTTLSRELGELLGETFGVHQVGTLLTGWGPSDRQWVSALATAVRAVGAPSQVVNRAESPDLFYGLHDRISGGVLLPGDAWVDPDEVVATLLAALDVLGVEQVRSAVTSMTPSDDAVLIEGPFGERRCDAAVVCTGVAALPVGSRSTEAVRPVRGSTVRGVGLDRVGLPMVRAWVQGRPFYLVGRGEARVLFGASSEESSGDRPALGELTRLMRDALDIVPALETVEWSETRTGLRPTSTTGRPFFDAHVDERWAWSSGHYRHGITLAPVAAEWGVRFVEALQ
jgi:glycine oxidase